MLKVFVINGYPQSGKDSFVRYCRESGICFVGNIVTSTPAKRALRAIGWDGMEKSLEVRKALSDLMVLSDKLFDGVFKNAEIMVQRWNEEHAEGAIFIHSREPENIERYKNKFRAQTIFVQRDVSRKPYNNLSDSGVEEYVYDIVIENNGTLTELREKAEEFIRRNYV